MLHFHGKKLIIQLPPRYFPSNQSILLVIVLVLLILQPSLTFETNTNYGDFVNPNEKSESTEVYKSKIKYFQQSNNNNNNAESTISNVKKLTEPVVISSNYHNPQQLLMYKYRLIQPYSAASYPYPTFATAPAPAQLYHRQIAIHPGT